MDGSTWRNGSGTRTAATALSTTRSLISLAAMFVPQVQAGTLTIMVGGDKAAYREVEPLLREVGTPNYVGDNGQGLALKLAINTASASANASRFRPLVMHP